jgi:hypothetical protein
LFYNRNKQKTTKVLMVTAISVSKPQTIPSADPAVTSWKSTAWKALKIGAAILIAAAVAGATYYYFNTPPSLVSDIADHLSAQRIPVRKFTDQSSDLLKIAASSVQDPPMSIAKREQPLAIGDGRNEHEIAAGVCPVFDENSQWKLSQMFDRVVAHDVSPETHDSNGKIWDWYRYPEGSAHSRAYRYGVDSWECRRRELTNDMGDVFDSLKKNIQHVFVPNPPKIDSSASKPPLPGPSGELSVVSSAIAEATVAKQIPDEHFTDGHFTAVEKPGFTYHRCSEYTSTSKPHDMYITCTPQGSALQCQGSVDNRYQYYALEDSSGDLEALCDHRQCVGSQSTAPTILPLLLNEGVDYDSRIPGSTRAPLPSGAGHPPAQTKPAISA